MNNPNHDRGAPAPERIVFTRRYSAPRPLVLAGIAVGMMVLLFFFAFLEFRARHQGMIHFLSEEAVSLARVVQVSGDNALQAYAAWENQLTERLMDRARLLDLLDRRNQLKPRLLRLLSPDSTHFGIRVFDAQGRPELPWQSSKLGRHRIPGPEGRPNPGWGHRALPREIMPVIKGERQMQVLGIRKGRFRSGDLFLLAYHRTKGGAFLLDVDVSHVKRFREKLGIQGLLRQLKALPGIVYVVLFDQTGEMARETDPMLPQPVEDPPDVAKGPQILHLVTPTGGRYTVLDIAIPLNSEHLQKGVLRLGLDGRGLDLARSKFLKSLIVRSALFLLVALLLLYYLLIYNNYQLLAREHQVIKKDVQRLEEEKQVSERLTAMGQLASGVAHEIRNPLNSIRMISQRLRMEFEPRSDGEEYERLTRVIQSESDRINRIISDFLRFARPHPLRKEMRDPGGCLRETLELLQPRLEAVGCELVVSIPQLPAIPVDCDRLKQVFLNLLENALEAVGTEGRIEVSAEKQERFLVFRIRDNGRGIAAEDLPKIFNLYFTTRAEGSGIGLAVVHQIISDHGGSVQVESQPGEGTMFTIYLPLKQRMTGRA